MTSRLPGLLSVPTVEPTVDVAGLSHAFLAGLGAAGMSLKTSAAAMHMQRSHLSRATTDGMFPVGRLLLLPPAFWRVFHPALGVLAGVDQPEPTTVLRAAALALADASFLVGQLDRERRSA